MLLDENQIDDSFSFNSPILEKEIINFKEEDKLHKLNTKSIKGWRDDKKNWQDKQNNNDDFLFAKEIQEKLNNEEKNISNNEEKNILNNEEKNILNEFCLVLFMIIVIMIILSILFIIPAIIPCPIIIAIMIIIIICFLFSF